MAKKAIDLEVVGENPKEPSGVPQRAGGRGSLTLCLDDDEYDRLATYAAKTRQKHQTISHDAVMMAFDDVNA